MLYTIYGSEVFKHIRIMPIVDNKINHKVGHTSELEKQLLKKLFKWANKNKVILIFTIMHFLKKK